MINNINKFYEDVAPIVKWMEEYRDLLNSPEIGKQIKEIRWDLQKNIAPKFEEWSHEYIDAINLSRQPQELRMQALIQESISIGGLIWENLNKWVYGKLNKKQIWAISKIAENLSNWRYWTIETDVQNIRWTIYKVLEEERDRDLVY